MTNGYGKSDSPIVPEKFSNNAWQQAAERMEGRGLAKGNPPECNAPRTQCRTSTSSALERVRQAAKKDKKQRFTALFHHVYAMGTDEAIDCQVYSRCPNLPPISFGTLMRRYLRQEPYGVTPHLRICAGGAGDRHSCRDRHPLADAILDRLIHNAHIIQLKGGSMRKAKADLASVKREE